MHHHGATTDGEEESFFEHASIFVLRKKTQCIRVFRKSGFLFCGDVLCWRERNFLCASEQKSVPQGVGSLHFFGVQLHESVSDGSGRAMSLTGQCQ